MAIHAKQWQVIKDDTKRTYEVCGAEMNTNHFTRMIHGMQRAGMNVSYYTPPVTNKMANKEFVTVQNYKKEVGLQELSIPDYSVPPIPEQSVPVIPE
jgi:hypothetical protein